MEDGHVKLTYPFLFIICSPLHAFSTGFILHFYAFSAGSILHFLNNLNAVGEFPTTFEVFT